MVTMETLPDELVKYRAKHNISIKEMAKRCKVSSQTIYSIENKLQTPSRLTFAKLQMILEEE